VLPSEKESFGLSALEAMACEVPVISSNAGGLPEVNINGLTGFTADIGDVQTMAARALELLQNPELHAQFRKNALAQAQNFTLPEIVKLYEQVYEQVVVPAKIL
jgi:glycosyltransferase involved in cell wall biosynthesis